MCGKLFQHKGVLNKHIRTIHDEKKTKSQKEKRKRTGKKSITRNNDGKEDSQLVHQQPLQTIQAMITENIICCGGPRKPIWFLIHLVIPCLQVQLEGSDSGHTVRVSLPGELVGQVLFFWKYICTIIITPHFRSASQARVWLWCRQATHRVQSSCLVQLSGESNSSSLCISQDTKPNDFCQILIEQKCTTEWTECSLQFIIKTLSSNK